jgi:hypothetical protein
MQTLTDSFEIWYAGMYGNRGGRWGILATGDTHLFPVSLDLCETWKPLNVV